MLLQGLQQMTEVSCRIPFPHPPRLLSAILGFYSWHVLMSIILNSMHMMLSLGLLNRECIYLYVGAKHDSVQMIMFAFFLSFPGGNNDLFPVSNLLTFVPISFYTFQWLLGTHLFFTG